MIKKTATNNHTVTKKLIYKINPIYQKMYDDDNMAESSKIVWLYASNYTNSWWLYDAHNINKLNKIYGDFMMRKSTDEPDLLHVTKILNTYISPKKITERSSDYVIYDDSIDEKVNNNVNTNITVNTNISINANPNLNVNGVICASNRIDANDDHIEYDRNYVSYYIKVNDERYYINIEEMKQINCMDTAKRRTIKRVEIPNNVTDIEEYLKAKLKLQVNANKN